VGFYFHTHVGRGHGRSQPPTPPFSVHKDSLGHLPLFRQRGFSVDTEVPLLVGALSSSSARAGSLSGASSRAGARRSFPDNISFDYLAWRPTTEMRPTRRIQTHFGAARVTALIANPISLKRTHLLGGVASIFWPGLLYPLL
jgi:hypothetical protein